ncbi:MAG TPA: hypothetical protein VFA50_05880 [Stellaceae bacterium]|nr:hypothetical protein [Stellaceae bacterium]
MRAVFPLLALSAVLAAGCANRAQEVSSTPPSVSYQVVGNDVAQANRRAAGYCQQYGMSAQLQGVAPSGTGNVASYICTGTPYYGSSSPQYSNQPYYGSSQGYANEPYYGGAVAPPVRCADALHQNLPGGSDYHGPPVPGCPQSY